MVHPQNASQLLVCNKSPTLYVMTMQVSLPTWVVHVSLF